MRPRLQASTPASIARSRGPTPARARSGARRLAILARAAPLRYYRCMPWDPVRDLLTMQERLQSLFGPATPGWVPPADLSELADRYVLSVELPGLQRTDVQIDFKESVLVVRGRRPAQACCPERYQQLERGQGQFSRSFQFALPISPDTITADLADGILTIVVPKAAADVRRLDVE